MNSLPSLPVAVLIPPLHVFATEDDAGPFRVDAFDGACDLTFDQLDAALAGVCRCGAVVDHRRGVELGDEDRLPIDIALTPPSTFTEPAEPFHVADLLDAGWSVEPRCKECRQVDRRKARDALWDQWRRDDRLGR